MQTHFPIWQHRTVDMSVTLSCVRCSNRATNKALSGQMFARKPVKTYTNVVVLA